MKKILFLFVTLFFTNSCWDIIVDEQIYIENNSKDTIGYYVDQRKYNPAFPHMYDTLPNEVYGVIVPIKPKEGFYDDVDFVDSYFSRYPDKKTKIYLFSWDTLNEYSWKEVRESSKYLIRYDLSYHELDSMNWTITYP